MMYGDFKGLPRRAESDKVLRYKAFQIAINPKYNKYKHGIASMVLKFFDKNTEDTCSYRGWICFWERTTGNELHKDITRKFERRKA